MVSSSISVPAAGRANYPSQSGVEYRSHVYPAAARICVSGSSDRLVLSPGLVMAAERFDN